tara:strand:- start:86 stop:709 length:624 start_codon:yes stop_codon:yes gene_type:complete
MGNLFYKNKAIQIIESIQSLHHVEQTLQALIDKYQKQIDEQRNKAKQNMSSKSESTRHIKRLLLIRRHQQQLENRMLSLLNKRYTLESLNVTKMHLSAIKQTSTTFKHFLKAHDIDKVCDMQETLTEMISDACEINDVISSTDSIEGINDDEIENEYLKMVEEIGHWPSPKKTIDRTLAPGSAQETKIVFPDPPSNVVKSRDKIILV